MKTKNTTPPVVPTLTPATIVPGGFTLGLDVGDRSHHVCDRIAIGMKASDGDTFPSAWNDQREGGAAGYVSLVQLKAQVVPNDAALEVATRNRERHFIFARLQQRRVEP